MASSPTGRVPGICVARSQGSGMCRSHRAIRFRAVSVYTQGVCWNDAACSLGTAPQQKKAITSAGYHDPCLDLDFQLCDFQVSTAPFSSGLCSAYEFALDKAPLASMCKVVDIARNSHGRSILEDEAQVYAALHQLQGEVVPKLYGCHNVWGILHVLALEPMGVAIPNDTVISANQDDEESPR
jgi:hypothetical protein